MELLLFLSLMVMIIVMIACSAPRRLTPPRLSPTLFPLLKLTPYDPKMITRVGGQASIAATITPPSANSAELSISPPRCYRSASPMLTCLGTLRNNGSKLFRDIMLKVGYRRADGKLEGEHAFALEQRRIEGNASAPYRFIAPARRDESLAIDIGLAGAQLAEAVDVTLTLEDERGEYFADKERYRFTALIRNDDAQPARGIRFIVTLENADGDIVGYHAKDMAGRLSAGEERGVDFTISPIPGQAPARHRVALEALSAAK